MSCAACVDPHVGQPHAFDGPDDPVDVGREVDVEPQPLDLGGGEVLGEDLAEAGTQRSLGEGAQAPVRRDVDRAPAAGRAEVPVGPVGQHDRDVEREPRAERPRR